MGRKRTFDVEEAIATATRLFWRGYQATSLSELTDAMGIGPASFYVAFQSKEALFRTAVSRYLIVLNQVYEQAFEAPTTALGVRALLRGYADVVTAEGHVPGCLVVNSSPAMSAESEMRQWLAGHRVALRSRLEERFCADLADNKLRHDGDPKVMAHVVVTLAGGIAVEAQSGATAQDLYAMIDVALAGLF